MFTGEVAVRGKAADGAEFSLFVSEDFVEADLSASGKEAVDGWLRVEVLAREGPLMLVRLPGETFGNGRTITVRDSMVETRPHREAV
jgi:hypothetical protein